MNAFITGSQVYGTPTPESDVDLCVKLTNAEMILLSKFADHIDRSLPDSQSFGKLNLLILEDWKFLAWQKVTADLIARKPVTREEAIAALDEGERLEREKGDDT